MASGAIGVAIAFGAMASQASIMVFIFAASVSALALVWHSSIAGLVAIGSAVIAPAAGAMGVADMALCANVPFAALRPDITTNAPNTK